MQLALHATPAVPDTPDAAAVVRAHMAAMNSLDTEWLLEAYGHDDFVEPEAVLAARHADQRYLRKHLWVAYPADDDPATALGYATLHLPLADNTHLAQVLVVVRRAYRGRGIGRVLTDAVRAALRGTGRTTLAVWTTHPVLEADHPAALPARTGVGVVDRTAPAVAWLLRLGFDLEQGERYSMLGIPADRAAWLADVERLRGQAAATAGADYDLVQWQGLTPVEWRERMAALHTRMSVDAPSAGVDYREEKWDVERVVHRDEQMLAQDHANVLTAVRHRPTGELVAYTELQWPTSRPHVVYQEDTLVHGAHRGHRLGILAKAANLEYLLAANPPAARIHTWNAAENRYMLAINEALGFRAAAIEGAWQKVMDPW